MTVFHPRTRFDSYVEGELSPSMHERIGEHLRHCPMCRDEVRQRQRILQAANSYRSAQAIAASDRQPHGSTVLDGREGVNGWKVVLSLGAASVAAVGVVAAAWMAGAPQETDGPTAAAGTALVPPETTVRLQPPAETVPEPSRQTATDPTTGGPLSTATAQARSSVSQQPTESVGVVLSELRKAGWNAPSLGAVGLAPRTLGFHQDGDAAELVMTLTGAQSTVVLHECRSLDPGAEAPMCPVGAGPHLVPDRTGSGADHISADVGSPPESGADSPGEPADAAQLPLGVMMHVQEHEGGLWTAQVTSAQATYTVESDLPVERAERVMSQVVLAERSRVQAAELPETPTERMVRGFERLIPWSAPNVSEPR